MPISVTIPTLGKPKNVKDAVISILSREWPLTARKLYHRVKNMGLGVSYQAVHKAVKQLLEEDILVFQKDGYAINIEWVNKVENFTGDLKKVYDEKGKASIDSLLTQDSASFTFNTVFDLYKFMLDTIIIFEDYYRELKNPHPGIVHFSHMWWALVGSDKEQNQFKKALRWKGEVYIICKGNAYADKLLAKFYNSIKGAKIKVKLGVKCANDYELVIAKDHIIQIYLPTEIKNIFDITYKNFKPGSNDTFRKFYENILFKNIEINVIINKNPRVAEMIRNRTLRYFKNKSKKK